MAINAPVLELLIKSAAQTEGAKRLVCLGYPDMLVSETQLADLCGADILHRVQFREDSESILRWHGLAGKMTRIVESQSLFAALGWTADFLDIHASREFEIVVDLNDPLPAELHDCYDLVYDGGTMEHCFNVGQVMRNILTLAKMGGHIVHVNPLNYYNHGFFGFNPTFYHDFYTQSGNRLASEVYGIHGPVLDSRLMKLPALKGFASLPERTAVMVAAQRLVGGEVAWPLQSKYRSNPGLRA
jgi:hypothetical protein